MRHLFTDEALASTQVVALEGSASIQPERQEAAALTFAKTLKARLSSEASRRDIKKEIRERANIRNQLLYASDKGCPGGVRNLDQVLAKFKRHTFVLLNIYGLVFPHDQKSPLVEQAVVALNFVLGRLKLSDMSKLW